MIKEAIGTGLTIDEAKENAILALGAGPEDDIQFEVLATPQKKILGLFGGSKAEVRVYVELPEPKKKKQNSAKKDRVKKQNKPTEKKVENKEKKTESKKTAEKAAVAPSLSEETARAVPAEELSADSPAVRAVAYLKDVLEKLGCENMTIKVAEREGGALVLVDCDNIGVVIGHRGETLDALQYLSGLAANSSNGYYKVSLNVGNYREKREQTLVSLANRVSQQVLRTGRNRALEPMNPYERRIIHTAVQGIEGVKSASVGEGSNRRVVIAPEDGNIRPMRENRRDGGRRGSRDRRPDNTVATKPTREPKTDGDLPLYGKIN